MAETEFWLLLTTYVEHILAKCKMPSNPVGINAVEQQILPLLDRFNFLSECKDIRVLRGILDSLKAEGFVLPISTRINLGSLLFRRAVHSSSRLEAERLADYAKQVVDFSFFAVKEAMAEVTSDKSLLQHDMLYFVEERICGSIFDQDRLLEYVLESGEETQRAEDDLMNSKLATYLLYGMQSSSPETRLSALNLACTCCFNSRIIFLRLLPMLQEALYLEDFSIREHVYAYLMDLIYIHHKTLSLQSVFHLFSSFLYAPTPSLQLMSAIGCGRLLLYDCYPDETECLLSIMLQRHLYRLPSYSSLKGRLQQVDQAFQIFFKRYSGEKKLHQDEIANTLVYMCLQSIEENTISIDTESRQILDNPVKAKEARDLHMALSFGLSLCTSDALDAVVDSLILNISDTMDGMPEHPLDKGKCIQWLHSRVSFH